MFEKALIATDLGESQEHFLYCKEGLRSFGVRHIVLAVCIRLHETQGLRDSVEMFFRPELDQRKAALEGLGYTVDLQTVAGDPSVEVNRLAEQTQASLIVIGSRLHGLGEHVTFGGVGGELLHHCRKPLLVLRQPAKPDAEAICPLASLERVLFPTDFSANAEYAFTVLSKLVENGLKSVVLMHVQDRIKIEPHLTGRLDEFNEIDRGRLERMKDALAAKGAEDVQIKLPYGHPTKEILAQIQRGGISLVLMGSQGRGFVSEVFLGSVSHNVARQSTVPALLLPMPR